MKLPEDSVELVLIDAGYSFGVQAPIVLGSRVGKGNKDLVTQPRVIIQQPP